MRPTRRGRLIIGEPSPPAAREGSTMTDRDDAREAARALRREGMPEHEIRAVLGSRDPRSIHRFLELHAERLEERLAARRAALGRLERLLTEPMPGPWRHPDSLPARLADRSGAA
jgi:hypothetical protein